MVDQSQAVAASRPSPILLIWVPSYFIFKNFDTWQPTMNTVASLVTFLLVAVLQNTQARTNKAVQHKLNAISAGLADLMEAFAEDKPDLALEVTELRRAVGLEKFECS